MQYNTIRYDTMRCASLEGSKVGRVHVDKEKGDEVERYDLYKDCLKILIYLLLFGFCYEWFPFPFGA